MKDSKDTICAISSPPGNGAIAIIRLSGDNSFKVIDSIFTPANKKINSLSEAEANTIHYGTIAQNKATIDDVLVSVFRAPRSYTGENSIEISCHGSIFIQQQILELLIQKGARLATPGEFTQRAFMNGKMDLSQAEGVADLIASGSKASHKLAIQQMRGDFSGSLNNLRNELLHLASLLELELDFSEEDVEFADRSQLNALISTIINEIKRLTQSFSYGNAIKQGVPVAIVGKTNVGKSTLLNTLLKEEKAIVSSIAGTTRDVVEDTFVLEGIQFRFIDTAGLRETADEIENEGIKRAIARVKQAQLVLYVLDISDSNLQSEEVHAFIKQHHIDTSQVVLIINKSDKVEDANDKISKLVSTMKDISYCSISALNKSGIDSLENLLISKVNQLIPEEQDVVVSNLRHFEALVQALESAQRAVDGIETGLSSDLIAMDIRQIIHHIGEITGEITTDEILGNIFKNFCIGK
ncbi:MAG: tRNA uridine-5-carboxymethylaminomethyl(34) synthesis GTPase MnmE [Bacteroidales bacterium]|nr:tRNA uridine-5-carboxymethylaminomethyl(34) synthesis GTPase MnmE [Bacteroidales bacterium]